MNIKFLKNIEVGFDKVLMTYLMNYWQYKVGKKNKVANILINLSYTVDYPPDIIHVMSQMILFTYRKPNNLFFGIQNNLYLKEYAKVLFHTNCTDGIYTIPNFDSLCVCAQKSIGNGISINQTELFKILQCIQNEEMYMWYGAECDDLDCIENFETLINAISNGLLTSSGELYLHYKKSNKNNVYNKRINRS